jgi:alanine racemase
MPDQKMNKIGYRPTWAEINLGNLAYNFHQVKKAVSSGVKVMVTVKADAYGHGLIPVAGKLVSCGVDYFGVASIDEGIELRKAGIKSPILVLGMVLTKDIEPLFKYGLTQSVSSQSLTDALNRLAVKKRKRINVHIKVDTGMGRIGVLYHDALRFIKKTSKLKYLNIEGIFTHLPCADTNRSFTLYQIEIFKQLLEELKRSGIHIPLVHTANSLGVSGYKESYFNMVRPGLIIYGLHPAQDLPFKLKPVLSLKTRAIYVKKVPSGWGISYGHIYVAEKSTRIVTLPIGYGDGYPRILSNQGPVLIGGKRFKISGRVCMDQIMVDVGDAAVKIGDEVVLIGAQGKNKITTEELAGLAGTIPYEIVCGLGSRIPRLYAH